MGSGTALPSSSGRLAIEQIYGYICWNSHPYGILTTATGFVFLFRDAAENLWISQMFASNENLAPGGYILPSALSQHYRFTISYILYRFTHLTESTERVVEKDLAQVVRVMDRYQTKHVHPPPPNITNQPYTSPLPQSSNTGAGGYGQSYGNYTFSLEPVDELLLEFKPWQADSRCGGRAFRATLIDGNQQIVFKAWDSYKHNASRRDNEVFIYMRIQSLWNVCLIGKGKIDFCHSLFLEFVRVEPIVVMFLQ